MKFTWFIGIDVSKLALDVAFCQQGNPNQFYYQRFDNSLAGFKGLLKWRSKQKVDRLASFVWNTRAIGKLALFCFLQDNHCHYTLVSPLHLKKSLGITRGKNDRIDAQRISWFACLHQLSLKPIQLPSATLVKLKNLMAFRDRLTKTKVSLKQTIQELKARAALVDNKFIIQESAKQLTLIEEQLGHTNRQLATAVEEDEQLQQHFPLINFVMGIGLITSVAFLVYTQNFTAFDNGRQFACYAGVAPFEYRSASSIRGKTQVSPLANRKMKALLSNGASAAVQHDAELKAYYHRKTQQGKAKLLVLNAVSAKLINRVFATVNRGTEYVAVKSLAGLA
jgi:transposase